MKLLLNQDSIDLKFEDNIVGCREKTRGFNDDSPLQSSQTWREEGVVRKYEDSR